MSRRGAGIVRRFSERQPGREGKAPDLQLIETPALGRVVADTARSLIAAGMKPPEVSSLMCHAAAQLAQQGSQRLSRDEWLTLCAVLWDEPDGSDRVSSPGGDA